jgi:hypothetical protein
MYTLIQLYTAATAVSRRPRRESERDYLLRIAREHRAERRAERRRRIVSRVTRRPRTARRPGR